MTDTPDQTGQVKPFALVLQEIRAGEVADDAARLMQELVAAVREHGKKGELNIKVVVEPMKGNSDALAVSGDVTLKAPRATPKAAIFFPDSSGNLLRDDPRQAAIPGLRIAPAKNTEPKDLAQ
ncbi:MAG: hypothetical protein HOV68_15490 [Streptomycetaceae bacterium]|nr:hypothetical protein [Streptomycetaceae bacterium]